MKLFQTQEPMNCFHPCPAAPCPGSEILSGEVFSLLFLSLPHLLLLYFLCSLPTKQHKLGARQTWDPIFPPLFTNHMAWGSHVTSEDLTQVLGLYSRGKSTYLTGPLTDGIGVMHGKVCLAQGLACSRHLKVGFLPFLVVNLS